MNLTVARPEEVAKGLNCLVMIASRLALADPLFAGNLLEALAFQIELEQRPIAAPGRGLIRRGVGWAKLLHDVEQYLLEGRPTAGDGHVRQEQPGQRVDLEQRLLIELSKRITSVCEKGRLIHNSSPSLLIDTTTRHAQRTR